ncbi:MULTISPECIES: glutathione peroxidase [unclassified Oleiphilus]|uniref:glutathione peroxidase n=1 Tax=unclassified Oleiphilus TaxID=2631174 RepID=UPI0007C21D41|nr:MULTISPECIES: glutathione peroxidase [unclassified Oleiphilus]KZY44743.1 glutathione peroxidase [Oleiphilus sp. HI0050]KZY78875.1 glutathione peroxidase [Oleiphilus sp. HI0069]KZY79559.1 glutathione peroxidase [Oleiphilus sp. HI0068]KZZ32929.1 glutathione peroxidase [Oleiphilus sp. HI0085]KZY38502.1 glutathione peroxidase [Oleiphilus sp. HI0043]
MSDIYQFSANNIKGEEVPLKAYQGKLLIIVNTASKCGFTPQLKGLEELYLEYSEKGLEILGFPCNQFLKQDPGTDSEISEFCSLNYGVTFPMFSKIEVNGDNTHPLYKYLKSEAKGLMGSEKIKWNFTKFLVDQQGKVVKRYAPNTEPKDMVKDIDAALAP